MSALALVAAVLCFAAGAREYYVDANRGDDANDGLTAERTWRTILRAQRQELAAGDRLLLRAGCVWRRLD